MQEPGNVGRSGERSPDEQDCQNRNDRGPTIWTHGAFVAESHGFERREVLGRVADQEADYQERPDKDRRVDDKND